MEEAAAKRRYNDIHEKAPWHNGDFTLWTAERTPSTPYHYLDGVEIFVAEVDLNPDDHFLSAPSLRPGDSVVPAGPDSDLNSLGD